VFELKINDTSTQLEIIQDQESEWLSYYRASNFAYEWLGILILHSILFLVRLMRFIY